MPRRDTLARQGHPQPRKTGRPSALTDHTADTIVDSVRQGNHITTACGLAHVTTTSLYRWLRKADDLDHAIAQGHPYDPDDLRFRAFRDRLLDARAQAAARAVDVVQRAMFGGFVLEEEPALDGDGKVITTEDGEVVMRRKYAPPDGRLALAYLGRSHPEQWGQGATKVELSGSVGGLPVRPGDVVGDDDGEGGVDGDAVARLAGALARHIGVGQEHRALEAAHGSAEQVEDDPDADVVDAEVVEEGQ